MKLLHGMNTRHGVIAVCSTIIYTAVTMYGEFFNGAPNSACFKYLGCDESFFGYDALEHFLFGFVAVWIIVWLCEKYPEYSILDAVTWKSVLSLMSLVALIAIGWEIGECFRDAFLLDILHTPLVNLRLHINFLSQPSNFDTMGDLSLSLLGSLLAQPFIKHRNGADGGVYFYHVV